MSSDLTTEEPMDLSADELKALARRALANHVYRADWLDWEDFLMLSEEAFMRLQDAVDVLTCEASRVADDRDRAEGIDSMLLLEQASNA